jgi:flagellar hook-length control protein FliK
VAVVVPPTTDATSSDAVVNNSVDLKVALKTKADVSSSNMVSTSTSTADIQNAAVDSKQMAPSNQPDSLVQQIVNQVSVEISRAHSVSHLSFQLVPENLGKVMIQVALVDQLVTAKILVANSEVREVLQKNLVELKTSLYQAGLQIDQLQVQVQGGGAGLLAQYYQYQQENADSSSALVSKDTVNRETDAVSDEMAAVQGSWNVVNLLV